MQGRGRLHLYNCSLFSNHSISSSSLLLTSMASSVTGETHNAFLELSNAISNVFHRNQRYTRHKTTLGSLKMAIDSLAEPADGDQREFDLETRVTTNGNIIISEMFHSCALNK